MPRLVMLPALLLVVALGTSACSDSAQMTALRSVSVTGEGEAHAEPDQARVTAGVQTSGKTAIAASRANESLIKEIMAALDKYDIEKQDIETSNYNIWVEENYDSDKERVTRYRVSNNVDVTIKDIDKVGEILAAVTNAGANSIQGVFFSVADTDALEAVARERAVADARARAASLAKLAGVELGEVVSLSTNVTPVYPVPLMMTQNRFEKADAAAPAPSISPGQQTISVQIQATYEIR